ncbi:ribosomal protein S18-alanine N-acetyltransferase [bacterium]|nr:ribosomal protein S18-alanine N-acetyltransferase [bacterium]
MILRQRSECSPFLDRIQHLDRCGFGESAWDHTEWQRLFDSRNLIVVLEFSKNDLIAFAVVCFASGEGELLKIFVPEDNRRRGTGTRLIDKVITELKKEDVQELFLEVRKDNKPAIRFYHAGGFKEVGERRDYYQHPPSDALVFCRDIS